MPPAAQENGSVVVRTRGATVDEDRLVVEKAVTTAWRRATDASMHSVIITRESIPKECMLLLLRSKEIIYYVLY
jgi:hypothetical protein